MDIDQKETKRELLATIERRFQFAFIVALYLPLIWDKAVPIFKSFDSSLDYQLLLGTIITSLLVSYVFLELLKKEFTHKTLIIFENLILFISFLLVAIIGTLSIYDPSNPTLWKFIVIGSASVFLGLSSYVMIFMNVWTMWKPILKFLRKKI